MIACTVVGNLGKDAEIRQAGQGKVCGFSVATKNRDKTTTWLDASLWGTRGEKVVEYLKKGTKVAISGTLSTREHNGKTYLQVDVSELELLGGGEKHDAQPAALAAAPPSTAGGELPF